MAWSSKSTFVNVYLTVDALVPRQTTAKVAARRVVTERLSSKDAIRSFVEGPIGSLVTLSAVLAWPVGSSRTVDRVIETLIDILLAILAFVAWMTSTFVVLDKVDTAGVVHARGALAVVYICFAMDAAEASVSAVAFVRVDPVNANALIETRG